MNHCNQCLHWDEEEIDSEGLAPCLGMSPKPGRARVWVTGDFTCSLFRTRQSLPKCATLPPVSDGTSVSDVPVHRRT